MFADIIIFEYILMILYCHDNNEYNNIDKNDKNKLYYYVFQIVLYHKRL